MVFTKSLVLAGLLVALGACSNKHEKGSAQQQIAPAPVATAQSAASEDDDESGFIEARLHRVPKRIERFDTNHDGVLQASEVPPRLRAWFTECDTNHDNVVTAIEIRAYNRAHPHQSGHGHGGHGGGGGQPQPQPPTHTMDQHPSDVTL